MKDKALVVIDLQNDITKNYCKYTNVPSFRTAESIGMHFACEYPDTANGTTHVSVISREDWLNELTEHMIRWAKDKLGNSDYAGWCLSFIEDALSGAHPRYIGWVPVERVLKHRPFTDKDKGEK